MNGNSTRWDERMRPRFKYTMRDPLYLAGGPVGTGVREQVDIITISLQLEPEITLREVVQWFRLQI